MTRKSKRKLKAASALPPGLESINLDAAAIDIGSAERYVAVPSGRSTETVRSFGSYTAALYGKTGKGSLIASWHCEGEREARVMARKLRVEFAGALYHVMSRGDRRENIFYSAADRGLFLDLLVSTLIQSHFARPSAARGDARGTRLIGSCLSACPPPVCPTAWRA